MGCPPAGGHAVTDDTAANMRIGPYQLVRRIGAGGMGAVYEAERADAEFAHRVAIKLMRSSAEGDLAVRRFRYERQILAALDHPNIAALLDGGITVDGEPYFVMEYVDGVPLTTWADAHHLTIRQRLVLFLQVTAAVQHAHQQLVVHRDLKPGNILVTEGGIVKLLDFGIARLLREDEGSGQLPLTQGDQPGVTPEYAAPEQLRGLPAGPAADVYALGVILYELLSGRRPFDLQDKMRTEIEALVGHAPPPRPSSVPGARRLRGDLDAIVLMALRKDPDRRYGSIARLADDIARHLDRLPVVARPDRLGYRLAKFVRRRRLELVAGMLVLGSLTWGVVTTRRQAVHAVHEREQATAVTAFFTSMLAAPDPSQLGRDITMREVLDTAAVRADSLRGQPELELRVRQVLSSTYSTLGEFALAIVQSRRAVEAARRLAPPDPARVATALGNLSTALELDGELERADSVLAEALDLLGAAADAETLDGVAFLDHRGRLRSRLGDARGAVPFLVRALDIQGGLEPDNDSALAYAHHNLAAVYGEAGESDSADAHFRTALALEARAFDDIHPLHASTLNAYATILERMGRPDAADSAYREVLRMRKVLLGPEHPDYAWTMFSYADLLLSAGRPAEAAQWARRVVALRGHTLDDSHTAVSTGMQVLGRALAEMDSLDVAERWLRESLALREAVFPEDHWLLASSRSVLAEVLVKRGAYAEAEQLLLPAARRLAEVRGAMSQPARDTRRRLALLYTAWGRPVEAARWREAPGEIGASP